MPKQIPNNGDLNWGVTLNNHLSQLIDPTNGGINIAPISNPTLNDDGHTYVDIVTKELKRYNSATGQYDAIISQNNDGMWSPASDTNYITPKNTKSVETPKLRYSDTGGNNIFWETEEDAANNLVTSYNGEKIKMGSDGSVTISEGPLLVPKLNETVKGGYTVSDKIVIPSSSSDYSLSMQDGNGRVVQYWNSTSGSVNKYRVDSERAGRIVFSPSSALYKISNSLTSNGVAGSDITWKDRFTINSDGRVAIGPEFKNATVTITGNQGVGLWLKAEGDSKKSLPLMVEGRATFTHDVFMRSGINGGFADGSNHMHDLMDISKTELADLDSNGVNPAGNVTRLQRMFQAEPGSSLRNNKASFYGINIASDKMVTEQIDVAGVTVNMADLTANSTLRGSTQVRRNISGIQYTFTGAITYSAGDILRTSFNPEFVGPIVAGSQFGIVESVSSNILTLKIIDANLKTVGELPLSEASNNTAISENFTLEKVLDISRVNSGGQGMITPINLGRKYNETVEINWNSPHNLNKYQSLTLSVPNPKNGFIEFNDCFVLDPAPNNDNNKAILVMGRLRNSINITGSLQSNEWALYRGVIDGIHKQTAGDQMVTFWTGLDGRTKSFQIGSGAIADNDSVSIGPGVYNQESETVAIGYDNTTLKVVKEGALGSALVIKSPNGSNWKIKIDNNGNITSQAL